MGADTEDSEVVGVDIEEKEEEKLNDEGAVVVMAETGMLVLGVGGA